MSNIPFRIPSHANFLIIVAILLWALPSPGQAQASCAFKLFPLPGKPVSLDQVYGVNDWGTVVGSTPIPGTTTRSRAFIHYAGRGFSYYLPSGAVASGFFGRNNSGVTTGGYVDASGNGHAFLLKGSTLTQIVHPKAIPSSTSLAGINRWNTAVGSYLDSRINGSIHGFKRYSNGTFIDLDYPVADPSLPHGTAPGGINDSGVVVGSYSDDLSGPVLHGFIYRNGQWAKLDFPRSVITVLRGISNAGVIAVMTDAGSWLYANGTFKMISVPNSVFTEVDGIAPGGLITGRTAVNGFTATCR